MSARILVGDMKSHLSSRRSGSGLLARTLLFALVTSLAACAPAATPTFFIPPSAAPQLAITVQSTPPTAVSPIVTTAPAIRPLANTRTPCTNNLSFVQDLTIPDGTDVNPGEPVDKQWLVTNSGTCDWDGSYRFKLISGEAMQAAAEQALFPARAGTQATLRVVFTAPQDTGMHQTAWQAVSPEGITFGEAVYMQISVSP
jgi:Ig-like domain-containing protein